MEERKTLAPELIEKLMLALVTSLGAYPAQKIIK
jgi:hypothetical protein